MAKSKTSFKPGQSGNPAGRKAGTGRIEEYRRLLEPKMPKLLKVLMDKALEGDIAAARLVLDRVYPVRDTVIADLLADLDELRALIEARNQTAVSARTQ